MNDRYPITRLFLPAIALAVLGITPDAWATNVSSGPGHADIMPYINNNTVETGYYDFDLEQVVEDTRLFVREMEVVVPTFFGTTNPGFTTFQDYTLPASTDLAFDVPTLMGSDGVARNLLYWDGEGEAEFGAPQPGEDFYIRRSSALNTTLDGGTSPVGGFAIQTTNPSGQMHNHVSFSARGIDGAQPGDGYYLFAMQLSVSGFDSAAPTYFLFNTDYQRDAQGQVLFNGSRPLTDPTTEQLAIDWVLDNFLTDAIPGDTDGDGDVDDSDLGTAFSNYTGPLAPGTGSKHADDGDTDNDGDVDDSDLGTAFAGYTGPLGPVSVPEPMSALLSIPLAASLLRRR